MATEVADFSRPTETVPVDREKLRALLVEGGRARVTVRSLASGRHVTLSFAAKKREDGRWASRATRAGRVGMADAACVFIDDHAGEAVARFDPRSGEFSAKTEETAPLWTARRLLHWVGQGADNLTDLAEVFVALECAMCGKRLSDPESIERGIGPECYGLRTRSRHA